MKRPHLTFRDPDGNIVLEGSDVENSYAQVSESDFQPVVILNLTSEGISKFSEATGRLVGEQISIYMDDTLISAPYVRSQITSDTAEINNISSTEEAITLAEKINSGSLPFSMVAKTCNIISPHTGPKRAFHHGTGRQNRLLRWSACSCLSITGCPDLWPA